MTNEEAISLIGGLAKKIDEYYGLNGEGRTAFDMAISALKAQDLHNTCTEVAQDTVSRQDAISMVYMSLFPKIGLAKKVVGSLMQLPSVQPEVIRCKNCKHWGKRELCEKWDNYISNEGFYCGCAERKIDE